MFSKKLIIGTAQFGMKYGIANFSNQPTLEEVSNILDFAFKNGVRTIDTAASYGKSEEILGKIGVKNWNVISKIPHLKNLNKNELKDFLKKSLENSLEKIDISKLHALLIHSPEDLSPEKSNLIIDQFLEFKSQGLIDKIGCSIYNKNDILKINQFEKFDIIQTPFNVFDRSFFNDKKTFNHKLEIHARSIFLQGLLLMEHSLRPAYFNRWNNLFSDLEEYITNNNLSKIQFCILSVLHEKRINKILVGIDKLEQLEQIINIFNKELLQDIDFSKFNISDTDLIDPRNWH